MIRIYLTKIIMIIIKQPYLSSACRQIVSAMDWTKLAVYLCSHLCLDKLPATWHWLHILEGYISGICFRISILAVKANKHYFCLLLKCTLAWFASFQLAPISIVSVCYGEHSFVVKVQISFEGFQSGKFTELFSMAMRCRNTWRERKKNNLFCTFSFANYLSLHPTLLTLAVSLSLGWHPWRACSHFTSWWDASYHFQLLLLLVSLGFAD